MAEPRPRICRRCILPDTFPGITFDDLGECSVCRSAGAPIDLTRERDQSQAGMREVIERARGTGRDYDCIVAYSGGKDSSYTLKLMVEEFRLRCLAVTIDNGFLSDQARLNGLAVTAALGVDLVTFRPAPAFMNRLYRESATRDDLHAPAAIKRASATCSSCIQLVNTQMIRIALERGAPLIAGGYIGGQVPKGAAHLTLDVSLLARARTVGQARYVEAFGPEADTYLALPSTARGAATVIVLNPMLVAQVTEEQIVASLSPLGWRRTADTGPQSTNCRLNDLGILVHFRKHGFNPYLFEMAEQVRQGLLDREVALARAHVIPTQEAVATQAQQIGLDLDRLR